MFIYKIKESYYRTQLEYTDGLGLDSVAKIQWYTRQPNKTLQRIALTLNNIYAGSTPR